MLAGMARGGWRGAWLCSVRLLHAHLLLPCRWCHILPDAPNACALRPEVSAEHRTALVIHGLLTVTMLRAWPWLGSMYTGVCSFSQHKRSAVFWGLSIHKQNAL